MPTDREIAEVAHSVGPGTYYTGQMPEYSVFRERFTPKRVLALLDVVEEANAFELTQEWGPVSDALDALDRSSE